MATKLYIAINGTCTAGPDENLFQMLKEIDAGARKREFSKSLNRDVTGGGTALWVSTPDGVYMVDTGDTCDREVLERSLDIIAKEEKIDPVKAVKAVYHSHAHLDHVANNDLFPYSFWMIPENDEMIELMLGPKDTDRYNGFRDWYAGHRDRGITSDKFIRYASDDHADKPAGLRIIDTPGHDEWHKGFEITDKDVVIVNLETGTETVTDRVVFTGDCLCDERYLQRALSQDPEIRKTAVYANQVPDEQWVFPDHELRARMDALNMQSINKLVQEVKKGGHIIFGHSGEYKL